MVRKIKAKLVLRLSAEGLSRRAIASSQGMSRKSVSAVLEAAHLVGVAWDEVKDLDEAVVYARLFPGRGEYESVFAQPDWSRVHKEMARVGVTLKLLHAEYFDACKSAGDPAMGYDRFCKTYQRHVLVTGAASRVAHKAAQSVEVDWSGPTMSLMDPMTGKISKVYLFVACLPFSRFAFCYPALDMRQETWLRAHVSMFEALGGTVPRIVSDNLKTGVITHPREGEIVLNDAYRELAAHYSAAVLPGRIRKPKDKASVENTVGHVATWVIASLRNTTFTSLPHLQAAIGEQMDAYNAEPFQKRPGSRASVFTTEEKPLLTPLPAVPFEVATWVNGRTVARNGHVTYAGNYYSVPFALIGTKVDLRITDRIVEVHQGSERVASHLLAGAGSKNQYITRKDDLPHGAGYQPWDQERVLDWARRVGPSTVVVVSRVFESVPIPEQALDPALAVLRLSQRFSAIRVEAACALALKGRIRSPRYSHLHPILATGQDKVPVGAPLEAQQEASGGFVRGSDYYIGGVK